MKPTRDPSAHNPTTLAIKVGSWFEAYATGWGVAAMMLVILLLTVGAVLERWGA
jgi:hypothetical protein